MYNNMPQSKYYKQQSHTGSKNPMALLNEVQIVTIRKLYSEGSYKQIALAATFGVNQSQISRIINRKRWS
jgi:DNA-binding MarR family transcriptional regulator